MRARAVARAYGGYGASERECARACVRARVRASVRAGVNKMHLIAAAGPTPRNILTTSIAAGPPFAILLLSRLHQHGDEHDPASHVRSRQLLQHRHIKRPYVSMIFDPQPWICAQLPIVEPVIVLPVGIAANGSASCTDLWLVAHQIDAAISTRHRALDPDKHSNRSSQWPPSR
jgi:hypothetical protein